MFSEYFQKAKAKIRKGKCAELNSYVADPHAVFLYLFLMMSLHTGDSSERSLRLSLVTITPSVFCACCSMNLQE